jgi:ERCC4-type nuclease
MKKALVPEFVKVKNSKKADDRVNLLTSVGGVTNTMAIDLLEHFGSIPQILHSRRTQKDLMEVKGIGRTKAKKILDLRKKY